MRENWLILVQIYGKKLEIFRSIFDVMGVFIQPVVADIFPHQKILSLNTRKDGGL